MSAGELLLFTIRTVAAEIQNFSLIVQKDIAVILISVNHNCCLYLIYTARNAFPNHDFIHNILIIVTQCDLPVFGIEKTLNFRIKYLHEIPPVSSAIVPENTLVRKYGNTGFHFLYAICRMQ